MAVIDITTSQQVVISYEVAAVRERIFAFVIDMILLLMMYFAFVLIATQIMGFEDSNLFYWMIFILISFYSLGWELLMDGQSPGKRAVGIKVMNMNGMEPSLNSYLLRWAFRLVDIWLTVGALAVLIISAGNKGQRVGDIVANTTVIRMGSKQNVTLRQLEGLKNAVSYEPKYPGVTSFSEEEMILLKEVMDRAARHRNRAHNEALALACSKAAEKLSLSQVPANHLAFLRDLITDYVALSR